MKMSAKRWLITGGNGFIGSWLSEVLFQKGYFVRLTTRQKTCSFSDRVMWVDELGPETEWAPSLEGVDGVVHLAARAHVLNETSDDPAEAFLRSNTVGTLRLAREAVSANVRCFIYISSIGVNGSMSCGSPFRETDIPNPHNFYAISKWEAEQGLMRIAASTDLEVVILRPVLVYGPRVKGNFLSLLEWIYRGIPLPLRNINNQRSFIGVQNFVDLIVRCIEHPKAANQTFLASDGIDLSTSNLIKKLAQEMNRPARLIPFPEKGLLLAATLFGKQHQAQQLLGSLQADCSKAQKLLGWTPPVSVDKGLKETASWYGMTRDETDS